MLPVIFYVVVFAGGFKIDELRENGWVFNVGEARDPWYKFYSCFGEREYLTAAWVHTENRDVRLPSDRLDVDMGHYAYAVRLAIFQRLTPAFERSCSRSVRLVSDGFYDQLLIPMHIGVSLDVDNIDLNRELTGHGISNLLAGAVGCV